MVFEKCQKVVIQLKVKYCFDELFCIFKTLLECDNMRSHRVIPTFQTICAMIKEFLLVFFPIWKFTISTIVLSFFLRVFFLYFIFTKEVILFVDFNLGQSFEFLFFKDCLNALVLDHIIVVVKKISRSRMIYWAFRIEAMF